MSSIGTTQRREDRIFKKRLISKFSAIQKAGLCTPPCRR
jgi:hypothetical protein